MSKSLDELKMLRQKKPELPASNFMTRVSPNTSPPKPDAAPKSAPPQTKAGRGSAAKEAGRQPELRPDPAITSDLSPAKQQKGDAGAKASINLVLKVPKSHEGRFFGFAKASNLPIKTVLRAVAKKFAAEFKETVKTHKPEMAHIEPFTDSVPNCSFKTTVTVDVADISHIDSQNLLDPKRVYDHWAQHEGAAFVARFLDGSRK